MKTWTKRTTLARYFLFFLACTFLPIASGAVAAATVIEKQEQEEGGIGGTGIRQDDMPDELFEAPELIDSFEDSVEINDVIDRDIPESPEVDTPEAE